MITVEQATRNIAKYARSASRRNWLDGARWYPQAREFCSKLAAYEGLPVASVAGCLAALSPQCSWPENIRATLAMVKTRRVGTSLTLPVNQCKAFAIVHEGALPETVLRGRKVKAFYANVLNPRYSKAVTVDTHAARAAFDKVELSSREESFVFRPKGNAIVQQAYRNVARRYKVLPSTLQAVVWLRVKDTLQKAPAEVQESLYIK